MLANAIILIALQQSRCIYAKNIRLFIMKIIDNTRPSKVTREMRDFVDEISRDISCRDLTLIFTDNWTYIDRLTGKKKRFPKHINGFTMTPSYSHSTSGIVVWETGLFGMHRKIKLPIIAINFSRPNINWDYVIAHEFGHYLDYKSDPVLYALKATTSRSSLCERFAYRFADRYFGYKNAKERRKSLQAKKQIAMDPYDIGDS
jgi:hypothetical protein